MLIDSHCHPDAPEFAGDEAGLLSRAAAAGVSGLVAIGGRSWIEGRATEGIRMWATAGVHPHDAGAASEAALAEVEAAGADGRVIGIGEIGLDYHYDHSPRSRQIAVFERQLDTAARRGLPVSVHCREAWEDFFAVCGGARGVLHCFSGGRAEAERALGLGWYLSFSGLITFPKAEGPRAVAGWAPAERVLVETDAPYLAPVPYRGRRNEPAWVRETAAALGRLRGWSVEETGTRTTENFFRLFERAAAE